MDETNVILYDSGNVYVYFRRHFVFFSWAPLINLTWK